jgi:hypothetical protein
LDVHGRACDLYYLADVLSSHNLFSIFHWPRVLTELPPRRSQFQ